MTVDAMKINLTRVPDRTVEEIAKMVEGEIAKITDPSVVEGLRRFLIPPRLEIRFWGWNKPVQSFPVWVVAESAKYDYCLMYSDYGFGPINAWGLGFASYTGFDADYCWHENLGMAYVESRLPEELNEQNDPKS